MGEIMAFVILLAVNGYLFWAHVTLERENFRLELELRKTQDALDHATASLNKPQPPANYQVDKQNPVLRPIVNSAQARKMVDRANAGFFSAEKHIPNSEIAKENANG